MTCHWPHTVLRRRQADCLCQFDGSTSCQTLVGIPPISFSWPDSSKWEILQAPHHFSLANFLLLSLASIFYYSKWETLQAPHNLSSAQQDVSVAKQATLVALCWPSCHVHRRPMLRLLRPCALLTVRPQRGGSTLPPPEQRKTDASIGPHVGRFMWPSCSCVTRQGVANL